MEPTTGKAKYYILMETLKEQILSGTIKPGQKLPSENELTREYALSRHTVRKALALLENEGYITAQHGKGTFCSERVIQRHNSKNIAVTGYDNSLIGQSSPIGITTIAHPQEKLGEMAAELILEKNQKSPGRRKQRQTPDFPGTHRKRIHRRKKSVNRDEKIEKNPREEKQWEWMQKQQSSNRKQHLVLSSAQPESKPS